MKTKPFGICLPIAATFFCWTASGGVRSEYTMIVNTTAHLVSGSLGSVRADTSQFPLGSMHCQLLGGYSLPGDLWVECDYGTTDTTVHDGCVSALSCLTAVTSTSPLVKVVQSINDNSYVLFEWDPTRHDFPNMPVCTSIQVSTGSMMRPVQ